MNNIWYFCRNGTSGLDIILEKGGEKKYVYKRQIASKTPRTISFFFLIYKLRHRFMVSQFVFLDIWIIVFP